MKLNILNNHFVTVRFKIMALVPYTGTRTRFFNADNYMPVSRIPRPISSQRTLIRSMKGMGISKPYRRRSKWNIINNRTNPVYPRPEVKVFDSNIGTLVPNVPVIINTTGSFFCINQITSGTGFAQRIGNQVATKSVYYQFVINFGGTPAPIAIRHMLVWDRQPNGAVPSAVSSLLAAGSASGLTAPLALPFRDRYVVLADDRLTLSPQGDNIRIINGYRAINQKSVYDDLASPAQPIPQSGALIVFLVSDEIPSSTATIPTIYGTWRVRFIDN